MAYRTRVLRGGIITVMQTGDGERWNRDFSKKIERTARLFSPKRTRRLEHSHVTLKAAGSNQYVNRYRVSAQARHGVFVHEGTGIYGPTGRVIRPAGGGAMGPINDGRGPRFIRQSRGQRANPWLARAADAELAKL